jgi:hypothetical protein
MNNSATRSKPTMALFNNGFKPNHTYTISNSKDISVRIFKYEVEAWALKNKIRMKLRISDPLNDRYSFEGMTVYFEDDQDLVAFKLTFNV